MLVALFEILVEFVRTGVMGSGMGVPREVLPYHSGAGSEVVCELRTKQ